MTRKKLLRECVAAIVLSALLAGCGGGGPAPRPSPPPPAPPPPPPPPPPPDPTDPNIFRTAEYNRSWGLEAIGAAEAYALGFTGEGVTIGIVDFNFVLNTTELDLHPGSVGRDPFSAQLYEAQIGEALSSDEHGHAVAVTAAGLKNNFETHGVAFDAQILAVDLISGVGDTHVTQNGISFHISRPWTYLLQNGARIANKSIGFDEGDIIVNPPVVTEAYSIEFDTEFVIGGGLLVSSAGNNSDPEPSLSNLQAIDRLIAAGALTSGPGALIIVGAVDQNNQIASFSDRAGTGISQNHFMVAPGVDVVFPWNGVLIFGSGTSFSAPHVSGAAALIMQRWPSLTAREVADILFTSATDLGAPGVDAVFGHGLLNVAAALQPIGTASVAVQNITGAQTATGVPVPVSATALMMGSAFGDAGGLRGALASVMMLDGFDRDFEIDLSGFLFSQPNRSTLADIAARRRHWQGGAIGVGRRAVLSVSVNDDRQRRARLSLIGQAASDLAPGPDVVMEFSGRFPGLPGVAWVAGTGLGLSDALARGPQTWAGDGQLLSITGKARTGMALAAGTYGLASLPLTAKTRIHLGLAVADNAGLKGHPVRSLREDTSTMTMAARVDRVTDDSIFALEAGLLTEDGSILGSRAAGGLSLTDRSSTLWLTLNGEKMIGQRFALSASLTATVTDPGQVSNSLLQSLGTITGTGFSAAFSGRDLVRKGDRTSLSVHQPLRIERAPLNFVSGIGLDNETGAVLFGEQALSLAPSGREIAVEAAYRVQLGSWLAEANIGYRFDADHVAGRRDALVLMGLARQF